MMEGKCHHIPQPKPTYAPKGYYRCERCNALVKKRRKCICEKSERPANSAVKVRKIKASEKCKYSECASNAAVSNVSAHRSRANSKTDKVPAEQKTRPYKPKKRMDIDRPKTEKATCKICGAEFERLTCCRHATMCQVCRKIPIAKRRHILNEKGAI